MNCLKKVIVNHVSPADLVPDFSFRQCIYVDPMMPPLTLAILYGVIFRGEEMIQSHDPDCISMNLPSDKPVHRNLF